jgi:ankyrin repeat protein
MSSPETLPFDASLQDYEQHAKALFDALKSGDNAAEWRFKWMHPRFRGKSVAEVRAATLDLSDAQAVLAHEYAIDNWAELAAFTEAVKRDGPIRQFETAVEAVIAGDVATLATKLRAYPELARARSTRRHHATLLHYVAANGVEGSRQKTPHKAMEVAKMLLDAGAEVDALADTYDQKCTTMSMLVSSCHPAEAGLQGKLAELLLDYGAALEGRGSKWHSALLTALTFGYLGTAETLARRGAPIDSIAAAGGLGRLEDATRLLPKANGEDRHIALALAAQLGQVEIVKLLLNAGEDPNRYNPDGFHSHATPLHQAVYADHAAVVKLLAERGARLDIRDTIYQGTPLGWAIYCQKAPIAEYLRAHGAPE